MEKGMKMGFMVRLKPNPTSKVHKEDYHVCNVTSKQIKAASYAPGVKTDRKLNSGRVCIRRRLG